MIKSTLELLEKNRDEAKSMALALQAQVNLTQGKMIMTAPGQEKELAMRERAIFQMKREVEGHEKMVAEFDRMIAGEKKKWKSNII